MIEKVKNGPVSDMICLIPKIRHVDLFGTIFPEAKQPDYCYDALMGGKPDFLRKAILVKLVS